MMRASGSLFVLTLAAAAPGFAQDASAISRIFSKSKARLGAPRTGQTGEGFQFAWATLQSMQWRSREKISDSPISIFILCPLGLLFASPELTEAVKIRRRGSG